MQDEQVRFAGCLTSRGHAAGVVARRLVQCVPAVCALLLLAGTGRPAHGQVWIDASRLEGKLPDWVDPAYVKPAPDHRDSVVVYHHWCEPVYRTVCKRIWHEPVVRAVWERVWVPPRYELRDGCCDGNLGRELVLVEPGHYVMCRHDVIVNPGFWETVELRELVIEGHYED